jgi:hypothetical protein
MCRTDYERADWSTWKSVCAAKQHRCEECRWLIKKGDRYVLHSGGYEGSVYSYRVCLDCEAWGDAFQEAQRQYCGRAWGWEVQGMWDEIGEFVEEHLGYSPREVQP